MVDMTPLRQTQKKYCSRAMLLALLAAFVFILLDLKPMGKGLILGTLASVMNFVLMGETLPMRIGESQRKSVLLSFGSILFRYVLMAVPLFLAIRFEAFNLFAVIFGIFMIQVLILGEHLFALVFSTRRKQA